MLKDMYFYYLQENIKSNFQKVSHEAGEVIGNKTADAVTKLNENKIVNLLKK